MRRILAILGTLKICACTSDASRSELDADTALAAADSVSDGRVELHELDDGAGDEGHIDVSADGKADVAVDGDIDAAGHGERDVTNSQVDVGDFVSTDADGGAGGFEPLDFGAPERVASTPGNSKSPVIASLDGVLHVVWHDFSANPANLYHAMRRGDSPWVVEPLPLVPEKSIFPELLAHGDHLHLAWQRELADGPVLMHAFFDGRWSEPATVMRGRLPRLALTPDGAGGAGVVHLAGFDGEDVVHAAGDRTLTPGPRLAIPQAFINTVDLGLIGTADGAIVGVSTSPGDTSYDLRRWSLTPSGWGPMETVYASLGLSSDDLDIVPSPTGPIWVWTEQDADIPENIPVVMMRPGATRPTRVTREPGYGLLPAAVLPPDGALMVAWVTPRDTLAISREPFEKDIELGGVDAVYPRLGVDAEGRTHVVFSGRDGAGVQQIWHITQRR
jgi:hypothetical protein